MEQSIKPLLIDHDDSFTFILAQYLGEILGEKITVWNHKACTLEEIARFKPTHLILSPGPGTVDNPEDFAIGFQILESYKDRLPILGVCLGHQGIGKYFGGKIIHAPKPLHGVRSFIKHSGQNLFEGLPSSLQVMRYHSLALDPKYFPQELLIEATSEDGVIMAMRHRTLPIFGVQFHPESVGSEYGKELLSNFLKF